MTFSSAIPLEKQAPTATSRRSLSIGLPASQWPAEQRFPLTPEGCAQLIDRGFRILMEEGAARTINYTDARYTRQGVTIVNRTEAWGTDIVVYPAPPSVADVRAMRRGAMLLTLFRPSDIDTDALRCLLDRHIVTIALDLICDPHGCRPFADILAEIDGRAALAIASSLLADPQRGKGILLGGVTGIVPCEVVVIGSGLAAVAASRSAVGLGATVRMFDNDIYSLRRTLTDLGGCIVTSSINPHTLANALRSADVVVATPSKSRLTIGSEAVESMKKGVLCFDLTSPRGDAFPSLTPVDLSVASALDHKSRSESRICYVNAGSAVARTAAMALSNTLLSLMGDITDCEGPQNAIRLLPGMQGATLTFFGKAVNKDVAARLGIRCVDISIFLTLS
ncbi:MAG: hypothetical protein K2K55_08810 [Duncaniella sp.]|nr:hypothetical protein [Duncaniella sp.]